MNPGIHSLPFSEYQALNAIRSSFLRDLGRSPAYAKWREANPSEPSAAMKLGALVDAHVAGGDPDLFAPKSFDARTNEGKAQRADYAARGVTVLDAEDYERGMAVVAAVRAHPVWADLSDIRLQTTVVWRDMALLCKARPDILAVRRNKLVLLDLKVCRDNSESVYPRKCLSLWHPQQLAWYCRGLFACGEPVARCGTLTVHPEPPHEVTLYWMSRELTAYAETVVEKRLAIAQHCAAQGAWPAGPAEVTVPAPLWAEDEMMESQFNEDGEAL